MTGKDGSLSIWFFIGLLLLIYGVLITAAGIREFWQPAARAIVLPELHIDLWFGIVIFLLGVIYVYAYSPRRGGGRS